jgi:hypothetical protein
MNWSSKKVYQRWSGNRGFSRWRLAIRLHRGWAARQLRTGGGLGYTMSGYISNWEFGEF